MKTENEIKLADFIENPDNPQTITDDAFDRLIQKIKRVPDGLTAKRIAYIADRQSGKKIVLAGNKRLRALKVLHGTDAIYNQWLKPIKQKSAEETR